MTNTQATETDVPASSALEKAGGQYLTFLLAGEEYGLEILKVQEIKGWDRVTPIPNTPPHVLGVLNLRGEVVPIVDLRQRFSLVSVAYGPTTVVIVVKIQQDDEERAVGLVVDGVAEVYRIEDTSVQPAPDIGGKLRTDFVRGLATVGEKMVILLEADSLIDLGDLKEVSSLGSDSVQSRAATG
ncbi:MAG: chemotaxis protein CheW [Congregibacter sp.]